jgi:hypothetical protein
MNKRGGIVTLREYFQIAGYSAETKVIEGKQFQEYVLVAAAFRNKGKDSVASLPNLAPDTPLRC